jgi:hypothetical protein
MPCVSVKDISFVDIFFCTSFGLFPVRINMDQVAMTSVLKVILILSRGSRNV